MITRIILHNFQCHRDVTVELGRSTVLQGNSNSGKTAILRALYWVIYNTPSGDSYVSYWAKGKTRFKADEYTSVTVHVDGHVIERRRSNDFNGYVVDGTVYDALRTTVPEEVTHIFNIADASVQRQMDAPFLLSSTPGEASQYLNSLAGLGCVDEILSIAKRKVADTSADLERETVTRDGLDTEIKSYAWVDSAEDLCRKADDAGQRIAEAMRTRDDLSRTLDSYRGIRKYPNIPKWLTTGDRSDEIRRLSESLATAHKYVVARRTLDRTTPALDGIVGLRTPVQPEYGERDHVALMRSVREYHRCMHDLSALSRTLGELGGLVPPPPCRWEGRTAPFRSSVADYRTLADGSSTVSGCLNRLGRLGVPEPCRWTDRDLSTLIRSVRGYHSADRLARSCGGELGDLYASLDGVACPVCGRPLSKDTCLL